MTLQEIAEAVGVDPKTVWNATHETALEFSKAETSVGKGSMTLQGIAEGVGVSHETVRRDLVISPFTFVKAATGKIQLSHPMGKLLPARF